MIDRRLSRRQSMRVSILVNSGRVALFAVIIWGWKVGTENGTLPEIAFSDPSAVWDQLREWLVDGETYRNIMVTTYEALVGFVIGSVLAMAVVLSFTLYPLLGEAVDPVLALLNAVPRMAMAPVFIIWFGLGYTPKIVLVVSVVFFIVFLNLHHGLAAVDRLALDNLRILGAGPLRMIRAFYVPALLGWLFTSLRTGVGFAFAAAVVAEYLGSTRGLGYLISFGLASYSAEEAVAGLIILVVLVLVVDGILTMIERHFAHWRLGRD